MLLKQGQVWQKCGIVYAYLAVLGSPGYCGKMYSRHLFPYGGFNDHVGTPLCNE